MNIGLSQLAFDKEESEEIYNLLYINGFNYVEGVLTKISPWDSLSQTSLNQFKSELNSNVLKCYSLQSLFFNVPVSSMCDNEGVTNHFSKLVNYAETLGAKVLVLGSPNLRKKEKDWEEKLESVIYNLDKLLDGKNVKVVIEPNCRQYKGEYFFSCSEITSYLKRFRLINIKTMVDTHNLINESLDPIEEFNSNINYIEHVHISENELLPIKNIDFHKEFAKALRESNYKKGVTYEIKKTSNLKQSIEQFASIY